jgi:hypothetical protein
MRVPKPPLCATPMPVADDPIPSPGGSIPYELEFGVILVPPRDPGDVTRGGVGASMMDPNCGCGEVVPGTGDEVDGEPLLERGRLGRGANIALALECGA